MAASTMQGEYSPHKHPVSAVAASAVRDRIRLGLPPAASSRHHWAAVQAMRKLVAPMVCGELTRHGRSSENALLRSASSPRCQGVCLDLCSLRYSGNHPGGLLRCGRWEGAPWRVPMGAGTLAQRDSHGAADDWNRADCGMHEPTIGQERSLTHGRFHIGCHC